MVAVDVVSVNERHLKVEVIRLGSRTIIWTARGYALEQTVAALRPLELNFYAVHSGSELDLFMPTVGRPLGVEFKRQDAPKSTRSMRVAWEDLQLDELWVVYPGAREYTLEPNITARPLAAFSGNHAWS